MIQYSLDYIIAHGQMLNVFLKVSEQLLILQLCKNSPFLLPPRMLHIHPPATYINLNPPILTLSFRLTLTSHLSPQGPNSLCWFCGFLLFVSYHQWILPRIQLELTFIMTYLTTTGEWGRHRSVKIPNDSDKRIKSNYAGLVSPPIILRHRGIWGAADEAVLNTVHTVQSKQKKSSCF
jgi:hypothetical protein